MEFYHYSLLEMYFAHISGKAVELGVYGMKLHVGNTPVILDFTLRDHDMSNSILQPLTKSHMRGAESLDPTLRYPEKPNLRSLFFEPSFLIKK